MKPSIAKRTNSRGSAIVEFTVVAPLLIFFLVNIVDLGLTIHAHALLTQLAREAVRQLSLQPGLEIGAATNADEYCPVQQCLTSHADVQRRIAVLLSQLESVGLIPAYSDPASADADYENQKRVIYTSLENNGKDVRARIRVRYKGLLPLMDGRNITVEHVGPYLR